MSPRPGRGPPPRPPRRELRRCSRAAGLPSDPRLPRPRSTASPTAAVPGARICAGGAAAGAFPCLARSRCLPRCAVALAPAPLFVAVGSVTPRVRRVRRSLWYPCWWYSRTYWCSCPPRAPSSKARARARVSRQPSRTETILAVVRPRRRRGRLRALDNVTARRHGAAVRRRRRGSTSTLPLPRRSSDTCALQAKALGARALHGGDFDRDFRSAVRGRWISAPFGGVGETIRRAPGGGPRPCQLPPPPRRVGFPTLGALTPMEAIRPRPASRRGAGGATRRTIRPPGETRRVPV